MTKELLTAFGVLLIIIGLLLLKFPIIFKFILPLIVPVISENDESENSKLQDKIIRICGIGLSIIGTVLIIVATTQYLLS